jgi:hypothetical protein
LLFLLHPTSSLFPPSSFLLPPFSPTSFLLPCVQSGGGPSERPLRHNG